MSSWKRSGTGNRSLARFSRLIRKCLPAALLAGYGLLPGCASLEGLVIRTMATDHRYQRDIGPYLWERYQEKMRLPAPPALPAGTSPEGLDQG